METTISSACPKCGTIAKSRKRSCCGRGGSWFGSCGSTGNFRHSWHQGIRACRTRVHFKRAINEQSSAAEQLKYYHGLVTAKSKTITREAKTFAFVSGNTSSTAMVGTKPIFTPANTLINGSSERIHKKYDIVAGNIAWISRGMQKYYAITLASF